MASEMKDLSLVSAKFYNFYPVPKFASFGEPVQSSGYTTFALRHVVATIVCIQFVSTSRALRRDAVLPPGRCCP